MSSIGEPRLVIFIEIEFANLLISRLLSEKGIPRLRRKAGDLKFKGKGHEVCIVSLPTVEQVED